MRVFTTKTVTNRDVRSNDVMTNSDCGATTTAFTFADHGSHCSQWLQRSPYH